MAWGARTSLGSTAGSGAGGVVTVTTVNVLSGLLLIVYVVEATATTGVGSVTDTAGNFYTLATPVGYIPGGGVAQIFYCANCRALSSGTITYHTIVLGANNASVKVVSAAGGAPGFQDFVITPVTGTSTTPSATSPIATNSNDLIAGLVGYTTNGAFTTAAGWTSTTGVTNSGANLGDGTLVNAGTGAQTFNPTILNSSPWVELLVGFAPNAYVNNLWPQDFTQPVLPRNHATLHASQMQFSSGKIVPDDVTTYLHPQEFSQPVQPRNHPSIMAGQQMFNPSGPIVPVLPNPRLILANGQRRVRVLGWKVPNPTNL